MKARFLLSTLKEFPTLKSPQGHILPEIALAGRSNVGKSSLLNHLLNQSKMARTSSTPGKTQLLNFFIVDEKFLLVDLPGYGFAKAPPEERKQWSEAIDHYVNTRESLKLILLLIDCRREFNDEDTALISWADHKNIPLLLVLTKADKLSAEEMRTMAKKYPEAVLYSVKDQSARHILEKKIGHILWD